MLAVAVTLVKKTYSSCISVNTSKHIDPKMNKAYCTIITHNYLCYALSLNASLLEFDNTIQFKMLLSDGEIDTALIESKYPNVEVFTAKQLCTGGAAKKIYDKYVKSAMDCFRWSMKPVFINHLIEQGFDQVFFLDPDLFFFSPFGFLGDDLNGNSVLLTPHWRSSDPKIDPVNFGILQTSGLFNAGFVGVSKPGVPAMKWWAEVCAYRCEKKPEQGLFVDQAYLDLMPIYFENIKIETHRGCNVANWNQVECKRVATHDGKVKINGIADIIFIHFTKSTINGIQSGEDYLLKPYLKKYLNILEKYRSEVNALFCNGRKDSGVASLSSLEIDPKPQDRTFLFPKLTVKRLDIYQVRISILKALQDLLNVFEGTLLDVGCGQMPYKPLLTSPPSKVTRYIGLDLEDNPIHDNHPDITWQNGKIPLKDDSIDCAICTEVLEHCPDPEAVLKEIHRVLKPKGLVFFTVPFLWPLHEVPYDQYRYTPFSLNRHLAASGFIDIDLKPMGGWDASLGQMLGLWVQRRPLNKWIRGGLLFLFWPIVWLLHKTDLRTSTKFKEGTMITGLSGTTRKP